MRGVEAVKRGSSAVWPDGRSGLRVASGHDVIQAAWEEPNGDLPQTAPGLGLVAGSRTGVAPVIELGPRSGEAAAGLPRRRRGAVAGTPGKGRGVELTLVVFGVAIALTLALLPGPMVAPSSRPDAGGPVDGRCVQCAPPSTAATSPSLWRWGERAR
jgi:hypothetical protein